jgi:hypothetical protein
VVDEQEFRVEVEHGRQIESELVWLDDAKDKYDDALASGHSAYLLSTPGAPRGTQAILIAMWPSFSSPIVTVLQASRCFR